MADLNDSLSTNQIKSFPYLDLPANTKDDSIKQSMLPKNIFYFYDTTYSYSENDTTYTTSLFQNHLLKPKSSCKRLIQSNNNDWLLIPLLIIVILYIYISTNFHQRWIQTIKAPFSSRFLGQLERDGNIFNETILFPMFFIEIISISLLLFLSIDYFVDFNQLGVSSSKVYLFMILGYFIFVIVKLLVIKIIGYVFDTESEVSEFQLQNFLTISISSLSISPLLFIYIYSSYTFFLYSAITILFGLTVIKNIKAFFIWKNTYNFFKIFIYLCTVEILPYVILLKTAFNYINK